MPLTAPLPSRPMPPREQELETGFMRVENPVNSGQQTAEQQTQERMYELLSEIGAALATRGRKPQVFLESFDVDGVGFVTVAAIEPAIRHLLCVSDKKAWEEKAEGGEGGDENEAHNEMMAKLEGDMSIMELLQVKKPRHAQVRYGCGCAFDARKSVDEAGATPGGCVKFYGYFQPTS